MKTRTICSIGLAYFAAIQLVSAIGGIDKAPPPAPPHVITFVQPKEARLENGLRVIVAERPGLPLLAAELLVRTGAEVDPEGRAGATSMTASLLTKGTEKMTAPQIASAIESLGGEIESGARWDASSAVIVVLSSNAGPALSILADVVLHPAFKQEEIDRLKNQTLDSLRVVLQQPGALARYVTDRVVYGTGEYGHAAGGTMETVQAIQRDDLVKLYKACYTPENATLILAGDVTLEQGKQYAQQFFGDWKAAPSGATTEPAPPMAADWKPENVVVDMPEAGQAAVTVAKPAVKRSSPDYYTGLVANAALGTGFVSRLNREIRIKRGLSYGARSALDSRRNGGAFVASAQTKNESAAEVAGLLQSELKRLGTEPVQGEELKSRQAVLTGGYARNLETNRGLVAQIASLATYDRPLDTVNKFIPTINAITAADVSAFAAKYFETPPSLIVVGKAPEFLDALKKSYPDVKVIPQADLDLNRADLVKPK
ncbi:MAG: zinc protease [Verrucomicrobiota bacterium]|jgi:zinc protease